MGNIRRGKSSGSESSVLELREPQDQVFTQNEFKQLVKNREIRACFRVMNIHVTDAGRVFKHLDQNRSGTVGIKEFIDGCMRLRGDATAADIALLNEKIKVLRVDIRKHSNSASLDNLNRLHHNMHSMHSGKLDEICSHLRAIAPDRRAVT